MTDDSAAVCFNSLQVTAPAATVDKLLQQAFSKSDTDDWGLSPQNFSLQAFVIDTDLPRAADRRALKNIWTNWIDIKNLDDQQQLLTLEFESGENPPFVAVNALVQWLKHRHLPFDLHYRYRLENEFWDGELRDRHPA